MADWDRADLTTRLLDALARPALDATLTQPKADLLLGDAQLEVAERLAQQVPESNYGAAVALETADNQVYSLPAASGEWIGAIEVYKDATLKGPPLSSGALWDCRKDYAIEGTTSIRLTCGRTRAFTPVVRYFKRPPAQIAADGDVVLKPKALYKAVVQLAAANFADRGGKMDPSPFLARYEREYMTILAGLKQQQSAGIEGGGAWFYSPDLGH